MLPGVKIKVVRITRFDIFFYRENRKGLGSETNENYFVSIGIKFSLYCLIFHVLFCKEGSAMTCYFDLKSAAPKPIKM